MAVSARPYCKLSPSIAWMPAVKENAAETCASKCKIGGSDDPLLQLEEPVSVKNKQEYDACYSKCVAQETKEVAEEREKVQHDL